MKFELTIVYSRDEEGWWIAEIPEIPGAFSQCRSQKEARSMMLDAANELALARREMALRDETNISTETLALAS